MKAVGIREFKNRLSAYIKRVRAGETVLVTDRDEVVAQVMPPPMYLEQGRPGEEAALDRLARLGSVARGRGNRLPSATLPVLPCPDGTVSVSQIMADVRADRV